MGLLDILKQVGQGVVERDRTAAFGQDYKQRWQKSLDEHTKSEIENAISEASMRSKALEEGARYRAMLEESPGLDVSGAMAKRFKEDRSLGVRKETAGIGLTEAQAKFTKARPDIEAEKLAMTGELGRARNQAAMMTAEAARARAERGPTINLNMPSRWGQDASGGPGFFDKAGKWHQAETPPGGQVRFTPEKFTPKEVVVDGKAVIANYNAETGKYHNPDTGEELKGAGAKRGSVVENRLDSAQAVNQTGNDIIARLSDPTTKAMLGPLMGRYTTLRDFVGNPPPEASELAGQIESYALANMGVHGMRSAQGAQLISALLDRRHTPESLIATVQGLNGFSRHYIENEGMKVGVGARSSAPTLGQSRTFPNGKIGVWDGKGWVAQ